MDRPESPNQGQEKKPGVRKGQTFGGITLGWSVFLFVVISMIVGMLFSVPCSVIRWPDKAAAESTVHHLKTAISTYFTEYRKYPVPSGTPESKDFRSNHAIVDVLLGKDNPRKIIFFSDHEAKPMGGGKYRKGVKVDSSGGGELWDPWGNYYHIRLDLNYDNTVKKPLWDKSSAPAVLPESILIWSAGKDGIEGTKDDIKTW